MQKITKGLLLTTSLALLSTSFAHKASALESHQQKESTTATIVIIQESVLFKNKVNVSSPVKKAIRAVLKNKEKLFDLIEKYAGKNLRHQLEQNFNKHIEPVLKDLLGYVALSWYTVNSKLYTALKGSELSEKSAKSLAYFVTLAMKNY
ncbi:hypothetical protein VSK91_22915 [Bacillus swezeyi]|uniref:hypothetical protein n=1 Tax=Bacillus swezeyi TaxID=1925020 RepID=UPI0039C67F39